MTQLDEARWRVELGTDGEMHVHPFGDLREHALAGDCWCNPTDDERIIVHHSMDRREEFEEGRQPS